MISESNLLLAMSMSPLVNQLLLEFLSNIFKKRLEIFPQFVNNLRQVKTRELPKQMRMCANSETAREKYRHIPNFQ